MNASPDATPKKPKEPKPAAVLVRPKALATSGIDPVPVGLFERIEHRIRGVLARVIGANRNGGNWVVYVVLGAAVIALGLLTWWGISNTNFRGYVIGIALIAATITTFGALLRFLAHGFPSQINMDRVGKALAFVGGAAGVIGLLISWLFAAKFG